MIDGGELTVADLAKLAASGISPKLARAAGVRRVDSAQGACIVGRNGGGDYAGLVFPNVLPGENHARESRIRRDHPDIEYDSEGKPRERAKYLSPPGRAGVYEDTMSGAKASRPGLNRLMADARARRIDAVCVWKLDRFGRSLVDCLNNIQTLESCGVRFIAITQGLDTDQQNPASRFLLHVLGAAAEFERSLIRERVTAGMKAAKRAGKTLGRPRRVFSRADVAELRRKGMTIAGISEHLGIGVGTVARALADAA